MIITIRVSFLKVLMFFSTTFLHESRFSALTTVKNKARNIFDSKPSRLDLQPSTESRLDKLVIDFSY